MGILVSGENLKMHFSVGSGTLKAVDGVNIRINEGETYGLVGESGCGKSTLGRILSGLYKPTEGKVTFSESFKGKPQMVFQDPYSSLDPRMTVGEIVAESLNYAGVDRVKRRERVEELLSLVGLKSDHIGRYPHEFSGGQRQRIGIARALAVSPKFIVCDEPISALDVSIQAQVINMLEDLQKQFGLTYLFISHDLSMVRHISHHVGVMYLGRMMEEAEVDDLYRQTYHPYTKALFSSAAIPDPDLAAKTNRIILQGDVPTPINTPPGCVFRSRCPKAADVCAGERPELREVAPNHLCACHFPNEQ
ncbi:MAG: ABC transporter ATP-binding protein [Oscillospiraceae bacterium]|jgi:oligopeptide/dipeptide ABC transporter ATP-binding protein|nr:ABC transporter ATP-binding protein [Oscillospiraceae bacterium]